jgi:hypothetical protein
MVNETKALADYPAFMGIRRERGLLEGARRVVFFGQIRTKRSRSNAPSAVATVYCERPNCSQRTGDSQKVARKNFGEVLFTGITTHDSRQRLKIRRPSRFGSG